MSTHQKITRRKAKLLLKEVRKLDNKHRSKLSPQQQEKLMRLLQQLEDALAQEKDIAAAVDELEQHASIIFAPYRKSTLREYIESIAIAVAIALFLRTFIIEPFKIPSGSMIPTLEIGDHIFVNKLAYGLWLPFVGKKIRIGKGPQRGDVIVFVYPIDPSKDFIKRVIGLPGDTIDVRNNRIYINGKLISRKKGGIHYYKEQDDPNGPWLKRKGREYIEDLMGIKHRILHDPNNPSPLNNWSSRTDARTITRAWGPKVPPGYVFVMGDNRDHSSDGREWGLVPIQNIKGKAILIWLSFGGGEGFRYKRIFTPIH